jgi:hypothetical protein
MDVKVVTAGAQAPDRALVFKSGKQIGTFRRMQSDVLLCIEPEKDGEHYVQVGLTTKELEHLTKELENAIGAEQL